jgi:hypothetical protein
MRFNPDEYITVHERIEKFYTKWPQGRILTSIVEHNAETGFVLVRAEVYREPDDSLPAATGHAYELKSAGHVQAGSYVEVGETSAVGRALALLGFEVRRGVASREEVERGSRKAQTAPRQPERTTPTDTPAPQPTERAPRQPSPDAEPPADLDSQILSAAEELGYDAAKVRKWVNQKFEVTGGLESLTPHDKREVLKIFKEQAARPPQQKAARK